MSRLLVLVTLLALGCGSEKLSIQNLVGATETRSGGSKIINGQEVDVTQWREVVSLKIGTGGCTGTLVGPKAILTSAHCGAQDAAVTATINGKEFTGKMDRSEIYPEQDHDLGFVILDSAVTKADVPVFASIGGTTAAGQQIYIMGYGCTQSGQASDGKLRGGFTKVTEYKNFDVISQLANGAAVCFGDSGGPTLLGDNSAKPQIVGVNSKGNIKDLNMSTRTDMAESKAFFQKIIQKNSVELCGINGSAATCATGSVPGQVTNLVATAGSNTVALTWAATPSAVRYIVRRATASGGTYLDIGNVTTTTYNDNTAANGTTYFYVVAAANDNGVGINSAEVSATPVPAQTVPDQVKNLVANAGNGSVTLVWSAVTTTSRENLRYIVRRSTTSGSGYVDINSNVTTTTFTDSTVSNGTTYYYVVAAANNVGIGQASAQAQATPSAAPIIPGQVIGVSISSGNGYVALAWASTPSATRYVVRRSISSGAGYSDLNTNITQTSYTDTTATNGTTYYYVVAAANAAGVGENSREVSATPNIPPPVDGRYPVGFKPADALSTSKTLCTKARGIKNTINALYPEQTALVNAATSVVLYACDGADALVAQREFDASYRDFRQMRTFFWPALRSEIDKLTPPDQDLNNRRISAENSLGYVLKVYEPNGQVILERCLAQSIEGTGPTFVYENVQYTGYLGFGATKSVAAQQASGICGTHETECQIAQCWTIR